MMNKETGRTVFADLCLDFDGVLHSYASGWQGIDVIPDAPVRAAIPMLYLYLAEFSVAVFSARSAEGRGIAAMKKWVSHQDAMFRLDISEAAVKGRLPPVLKQVPLSLVSIEDWERWFDQGALVERVVFPTVKPASQIYIDDRGFRFQGDWPDPDTLRRLFTPWHKRGR